MVVRGADFAVDRSADARFLGRVYARNRMVGRTLFVSSNRFVPRGRLSLQDVPPALAPEQLDRADAIGLGLCLCRKEVNRIRKTLFRTGEAQLPQVGGDSDASFGRCAAVWSL